MWVELYFYLTVLFWIKGTVIPRARSWTQPHLGVSFSTPSKPNCIVTNATFILFEACPSLAPGLPSLGHVKPRLLTSTFQATLVDS
jgi:hypothetical protein